MSGKCIDNVIAYVDGFNLYFGLKENQWQHFYWLNARSLCESLLLDDQRLVVTKYFTARIAKPEDKRLRQAAFCQALESDGGIRVIYGRYKYNKVQCRGCGRVEDVPTEKRSDVSLAVEMLMDAHNNQFDVALLLSGDTDFCPVVQAVTSTYPNKRVVVCFPPGRQNKELREVATASLIIGRAKLAQAQFPDKITRPNGNVLTCPEQWTAAYRDRIDQKNQVRKQLRGGLDRQSD